MIRRSTIPTRLMRLTPAILQTVWGPALCMAMLNAPMRTQSGSVPVPPAGDPISAVYAGIFNPIRPVDSFPRELACMVAPGPAPGPIVKDAAHDHAHFSAFPWAPAWKPEIAAKTHVFEPAHAAQVTGCQWSAPRGSGLNSAFNAFYGVSKSWGIGNRRIPRLIPSYWARFALPSDNGSDAPARPYYNPRSQDLAKLGGSFGKAPIADLVKAGFFNLVALAEDAW